MRHLDDNLLLMILEGQLPPRRLLQVMYDHLRELCPECRANLELVAREMDWALDGGEPFELESFDAEPLPELLMTADPEPADGPAYGAAFDNASHAVLHQAGRLDAERRQAQRDLAELRALSAAERAERVTTAKSRFASRSLAELLLDECREAVRRDPEDARVYAELVPQMLRRLPGATRQAWGEELHARALAHRGNAFRVAGDVQAADNSFLALHQFLSRQGLQLDDLSPDVASLEASLRYDQGRFQEAAELLDTAVQLAQVSGDTVQLARFLVQRGDVHRFNEHLDEAQRDLRQALSLLDPEQETHLFLCGVGNYGLYLCEAGEHHEAARLLERHEDLFRRNDEPWLYLRTEILRAKIAHGLGRGAEAERCYLAARDGFAERDLPFHAALISLDLAQLYVEEGRSRELAELAAWMVAVFESRELPARANVALMLFQQAVAAKQVTVEALRGLRSCLEQAQMAARRAAPLPS